MLFLFLALYIPNRKNMFGYPEGKPEPISIVMPCYNEGHHIGEAIEALLKLDYPKEMIEIIVVDDKSNDNSVEVIKKYAQKYKNVKLIVNRRNSGGAAEPLNIGIRYAKYNYVAVVDSDSIPDKDSLRKMIGFLQQDSKVGVVTCSILVKKPWNLLQKLQAYEYFIIAFTRRLLDMVDSIYVTPGPLALYRKDVLMKVGLFDTKNMTQDIEMTWNIMAHGYYARMCLDAKVYAASPSTIKSWWKQRIRWNLGGIQTLFKYKKKWFKGMLGMFVMPLFALGMGLGVFGIGLMAYLLIKRFVVGYLATKYSLYASTAILSLGDFTFAPSILNFFGVVSFILGFWFTIFGLAVMKANDLRGKKNIFNLAFYLIVYLIVYPFTFLTAVYQMIRGEYSWR
jgi:cellulose synthase/poly-beta-1,6-N-acetylglucosamine synthase-like glycosyltransferase